MLAVFDAADFAFVALAFVDLVLGFVAGFFAALALLAGFLALLLLVVRAFVDFLDRLLLARDALLDRFGRDTLFQPLALSARKDDGIATASSGLSVTAAAAASARSARTSEMTFDGRRALAACTRLVSSTTNMSRSGSIQSEVPV